MSNKEMHEVEMSHNTDNGCMSGGRIPKSVCHAALRCSDVQS